MAHRTIFRVATVTSFSQESGEDCEQCSLLTVGGAVAAKCQVPAYLHQAAPTQELPVSSMSKQAADRLRITELMDASWGQSGLEAMGSSASLISCSSQDTDPISSCASDSMEPHSDPSSPRLCTLDSQMEGDAEVLLTFPGPEDKACNSQDGSPARPHAKVSLSLSRSSQQGPGTTNEPSVLHMLLTSLWEECAARGLFRYDVLACESRVLPGRWGWMAQLNEGRYSKKRATEVAVDCVLQAFDERKFHFGKALLREALMRFEPLPPTTPDAWPLGYRANTRGARVVESAPLSSKSTLVMINVSPIDYGHILLVPHVLEQQPQQLRDAATVAQALALAAEVGSSDFRLGYNSLGAFATINHLHFQGYFSPHKLPCQRAATGPLPLPGGLVASQRMRQRWPRVEVLQLEDYPVRGWVLQALGDSVNARQQLSHAIMALAGHMQAIDQPFNVLMVDCGQRVFVWPQCYAAAQAAGTVAADLLDTGVNPAVFEISGHLLLKREVDFKQMEEALAVRLLSAVSVDAASFAELSLCLA